MPKVKEIVSFVVPDGAFYVAIPRGISKADVFAKIFNLKEEFIKHPKTRITWDDQSLDGEILNSLEKLSEQSAFSLKIKKYNTNFFKINLSDLIDTLKKYPESDWKSYKSEYIYFQLDYQKKDDFELVKNFMLSSFGVVFKKINGEVSILENKQKIAKIQQNFNSLVENKLSKTFLVQNLDGKLIGCFTLVDVYGDIQLHSVAGMAKNREFSKVKKLPLIIAATLDLLSFNDAYKNSRSLTFSNSNDKVSKLYSNLGISRNFERKGYFVEKSDFKIK